MELFIICIQLFFIRLLDISIGTIRTLMIVKNKNIAASIFGFFEVLIWFFAVDKALNTEINSILIPISYASGFALGTLIGTHLAKLFLNPIVSVQIISDKINNKAVKILKSKDFNLNIIKLEKCSNKDNKLIIIETNYKEINELEKIMKEIDKKAYIYINDIKQSINNYVKKHKLRK